MPPFPLPAPVVGDADGEVLLDGLGEAVGVLLGPPLGLGVGDGDVEVSQDGRLITLVSRVTDPLRASTRPWTDAPVARVVSVSDITVPTKVVLVPRVVLLPTCQ